MLWFVILMLGGHPVIIDMPSKEVCQEVLRMNQEYNAKCWAREPEEKLKCDDDVCEGR